MKYKPIPFSGPMVKAIQAGQKTQTRRVLKNPEYYGCPTGDCPHSLQSECDAAMNAPDILRDAPYQVGDRLYVKEAWRAPNRIGLRALLDELPPREIPPGTPIRYEADGLVISDCAWTGGWGRYRHDRFMPRWASRITLEVTGVRCELLRDISEEDAIAEGVSRLYSESELASATSKSMLAEMQRVNERSWLNYLWHGHPHLTRKQVASWPHQFSSYDTARGSFSSLIASIHGPEIWDLNPYVRVYGFKVIPQ